MPVKQSLRLWFLLRSLQRATALITDLCCGWTDMNPRETLVLCSWRVWGSGCWKCLERAKWGADRKHIFGPKTCWNRKLSFLMKTPEVVCQPPKRSGDLIWFYLPDAVFVQGECSCQITHSWHKCLDSILTLIQHRLIRMFIRYSTWQSLWTKAVNYTNI